MARKKDLFVTRHNSPMEKATKLMELEAQKKIITEQIAQIKEELLDVTRGLGVLTLKTEKYTISRAERKTITVGDFNTLLTDLQEKNIPVLTETVFAKQMDLVFKKLVEEDRIPKGLDVKRTEYLSVRLKEEK